MNMVISNDRFWCKTTNLALPLYRPREQADLTAQYNTAMWKLDKYLSSYPSIVSGSGAPTDEVRSIAHRFNVPVTATLMGLGVYPSTDKQFLWLTCSVMLLT